MLTRRTLFSVIPSVVMGAVPAAVRIDDDIPGGNIIVDAVDGDTVSVRQDLRDTEGDWFYWAFRVRGAAGRKMTFRFPGRAPLSALGPAVSLDRGHTWQWLGADSIHQASFTYTFPARAEEVRFSVNIPYFEADLVRFLDRHRGSPHLKAGVLAKSRKGRDIEMLRVGNFENPKMRAILTARHHACESLASYSLEGILAGIVEDTAGTWLRENVEFLVVPFMDKDGVEDGDQGKNRRPHDHNRDYDGESIHPSVKALRELTPKWSDGRLRFAMDLHCPYISGKGNEEIYFVGSRHPEIWREAVRFSKILESVQSGPLVYRAENNLPYGEGWNTDANTKGLKSFGMWAAEQPGIRFASTLEIPYATAGGTAVTAASARALGIDLAKAIGRYLEG